MMALSSAKACDALDQRLEPIDLRQVDDEGLFVTRSGERLVMASVRFPEPDKAGAGWVSDLRALSEGSVVEAAVLGAPDRWGRRPALLVLRFGDGSASNLSERFVEAGEALAWPGEADDPCFGDLLKLEATTRKAGRGQWGKTFQIFDARSPSLAVDRIGKPLLARGRVEAVVVRRNVIYINFGASWRNRLGVLVRVPTDRAGRKALTEAVMPLAGRNVLIRGIVESGAAAPRIIIRDARQIMIEDESLN